MLSWTKKNHETHYGYKNHINADAATKLIQDYRVTPAHVHDSRVFEDLLDTQTAETQGGKRPVYADSAYRFRKTRRASDRRGDGQPNPRKRQPRR
jgi:IS5 family transposase